MWWAAASLGLGALGAASNFFGRKESARLMRGETDEEVRRFHEQGLQRIGQATAAGAASGVEFESKSTQDYLAKMTDEFRRQEQWMRDSGYRRADAVDTSSYLGLAGDLGSSMFQYGSANNWWRTPSLT
jgi:hypothetical protein